MAEDEESAASAPSDVDDSIGLGEATSALEGEAADAEPAAEGDDDAMPSDVDDAGMASEAPEGGAEEAAAEPVDGDWLDAPSD